MTSQNCQRGKNKRFRPRWGPDAGGSCYNHVMECHGPRRRLSIIVVMAALLPATPAGVGVAMAQIDAGFLATVTDLKETTAYLSSENATEVSLGLTPPEPNGGPGISLVFRARFNGRNVDPDRLAGFVVRAHYRLHSDDRVRSFQALGNTHRLHMSLDAEVGPGITLDFFPANWGYGGFAPPGDEIPVAFFAVTVEDLRALSLATSVRGNVLWTDFRMTAEELDALRAFIKRVTPPQRRTP